MAVLGISPRKFRGKFLVKSYLLGAEFPACELEPPEDEAQRAGHVHKVYLSGREQLRICFSLTSTLAMQIKRFRQVDRLTSFAIGRFAAMIADCIAGFCSGFVTKSRSVLGNERT